MSIIPFAKRLGKPLQKKPIEVLQINLGKRCNIACVHCHVDAGPHRTEELSDEVLQDILEILQKFPQIKTVDLTGGAPEMNYGFRPIVELATELGKEVIVRSNLTIFFVEGYTDLPDYLADHKCRVVASLPCYQEDNVDKMRGIGVFQNSIKAIEELNKRGYGNSDDLILDLVYNPQLPKDTNFSLTADQKKLERDYKKFLSEEFGIVFNSLFTITNIPIGRTGRYLERKKLREPYETFLSENYNPATVPMLMCGNELSIDYMGNVFDCDFNQMEEMDAVTSKGEKITLKKLLEEGSLDIIPIIRTANHCYGCTAGSGASCGGALVS